MNQTTKAPTFAEETHGLDYIESLETIVLDGNNLRPETRSSTEIHYGKLVERTADEIVYFDISACGYTGPYVRFIR